MITFFFGQNTFLISFYLKHLQCFIRISNSNNNKEKDSRFYQQPDSVFLLLYATTQNGFHDIRLRNHKLHNRIKSLFDIS